MCRRFVFSVAPPSHQTRAQVIVTVALVPPKKGVFHGAVKHVLAVATTVEVILLAVTYQGGQADTSHRNRRIQVRASAVVVDAAGFLCLPALQLPAVAFLGGRVFSTRRGRASNWHFACACVVLPAVLGRRRACVLRSLRDTSGRNFVVWFQNDL